MKFKSLYLLSLCSLGAFAQNIQNNPGSNHGNKFEQLGTILPTPNVYRTASGHQVKILAAACRLQYQRLLG